MQRAVWLPLQIEQFCSMGDLLCTALNCLSLLVQILKPHQHQWNGKREPQESRVACISERGAEAEKGAALDVPAAGAAPHNLTRAQRVGIKPAGTVSLPLPTLQPHVLAELIHVPTITFSIWQERAACCTCA